MTNYDREVNEMTPENEKICDAIREAGDTISGAIRDGFGPPTGVPPNSLLAINAEETSKALDGINTKLGLIVQLLQSKGL